MPLEVRIFDEAVLEAIRTLPPFIMYDVNVALNRVLPVMAQTAKQEHRYKRRTGRLTSAITSEVRELTGELFIDNNVAQYGIFVHDGQRSWKPDPFIYNSADKNQALLDKELALAIDKTLSTRGMV